MDEFWESLFKTGGALWGFEPADSAILTSDIFSEKGLKNILVPGIGYGRNVKPFTDKGMKIAGIEISKTAVDLIEKSESISNIYCGSILEMPFNNEIFDGIYCYALLHLFNSRQRKVIISNCFNQLGEGGIMIFCVVSSEYDLKNSGKLIGENRFLMPNGLKVFYYSNRDIEKEFRNYGLIEYRDIDEPIKFLKGEPAMKFKMITCKK